MTACAACEGGLGWRRKEGTSGEREREREGGNDWLCLSVSSVRSITFAVGYTIGIPDLL